MYDENNELIFDPDLNGEEVYAQIELSVQYFRSLNLPNAKQASSLIKSYIGSMERGDFSKADYYHRLISLLSI